MRWSSVHGAVALCLVLACEARPVVGIDRAAGDGGAAADGGAAVDGRAEGAAALDARAVEAGAEAGDDGAAAVALLSTCGHLFDAITSTRCGGISLPAASLAQARAAYQQSCAARLRLPGTSWTASSLEACVAAARLLPCDATLRSPACIVAAGARPDGAACSDDAQCASTRCARSIGAPPGGGVPVVPACGTCSPASAAGQPCASGAGDGCADGTACVASGAGRVCAPVTAGGAGDSCDGTARVCAAGLSCDATRVACVPLAARGDACASSEDCDRPTACLSGRCTDPAPAGSPCGDTRDCASGLLCAGLGGGDGRRVPTCVAPAWAAPGETCDDSSPCLVGACPGSSGVCPRLLPDGAACVAFDPAATCGLYSACTDGRCSLEYSVPCP